MCLGPVAGQLKSRFPTLDFKSQELEAMRDVDDPGFLPVERHTKRFEDPSYSHQGVFRLRSSPTGHNPVIRPACEPVRASGRSSLTTPWGFPCLVRFPGVHADATTPAQRLNVSLRSFHPDVSIFPALALSPFVTR